MRSWQRQCTESEWRVKEEGKAEQDVEVLIQHCALE